MKNLLLSLFTFALASNAYTQTTFQKTFGGDTVDISYSVQKTGDGGYIITGYTQSFGAGNEDIYLIKTNTIGDTLWTKTFGGIGPDYGRSVKETTDNGYIIVGNANGLGPGGWDAYLIRVDSIGDTLWTKIYGGTLNDDGFSVQQTSNGGFVFTGYFYNSISGSYDIYLVNTNANGDTLWTKTYGGSNWDVGNFIIENPDGGYTIAGYTASFGAGLEDFYIIKTDSIGNSGGCNEFSTNTIVINPATQHTASATPQQQYAPATAP